MKLIYTATYFLSIIGIMYLASLVILSGNRAVAKSLMRVRFNPRALYQMLNDQKTDERLKAAGWSIRSNTWNLIRYGSVTLWLLLTYISDFLRGNSISYVPLLIGIIIILLTSSLPFTPFGFLLMYLKRQVDIKKDGEIISLLRLYENNRQKHNHMHFSAFCYHIAGHFRYLQQDLHNLSHMIVEDGLENALDWYVNQFPKDHPFIDHLRTIVLTTESLDHADAVEYLKRQSNLIAEISSDQYARRWSVIGDLATLFNVLPAAAAFLMMLIIMVMYLNLIRVQISI